MVLFHGKQRPPQERQNQTLSRLKTLSSPSFLRGLQCEYSSNMEHMGDSRLYIQPAEMSPGVRQEEISERKQSADHKQTCLQDGIYIYIHISFTYVWISIYIYIHKSQDVNHSLHPSASPPVAKSVSPPFGLPPPSQRRHDKCLRIGPMAGDWEKASSSCDDIMGQ